MGIERMSKQDVTKIIITFREAFPNGAEPTQNTVNLWHMLLKSYDFDLAWQSALEVISEWDAYTMPPPAVLIKKINSKDSVRYDELISEARTLLRKGTVLTNDEFYEASPEIIKYFRCVAEIKRLALKPVDYTENELERFRKELPEISHEIRMSEIANLSGTTTQKTIG